VDYLLNTYFDIFAEDIYLYCAFIKHGNHIYISQRRHIKNFLFTIKFILKHKQKIKVFKETVWKK
ncbi:hypothetical protein, partial [Treponema sp.]|uniref:hypothetical protein n=1 Tax=Treponema sp. TaxID=166 RepID=UPI00298DFEB7